jgi:hypothetical protein
MPRLKVALRELRAAEFGQFRSLVLLAGNFLASWLAGIAAPHEFEIRLPPVAGLATTAG